nr:AAA family ATPase [Leucobacter sp. G161]
MESTMIDQTTVGYVAELAERITQSVSRAMSDSREAVDAAVATLFAGGHLLIEDVPGVGKTTLATALGRSIDASVRRLQFTSDMLPSDVTGLSVYHQDAHEFTFHPGPIFSNIVIADEINRGTAKTQSALLEAMAERTVTIAVRRGNCPSCSSWSRRRTRETWRAPSRCQKRSATAS